MASTPTGAMVVHPTTSYPQLAALTGRLDEVSRADHNRYVDAAALATGLFGDATTANILLLGVAVQRGRRRRAPGRHRAGHRAQRRRRRPQRRRRSGGAGAGSSTRPRSRQAAGFVVAAAPETTDELIERLAADLVGFQSEAYARRFRDLVGVAPRRRAAGRPGEHGVHRGGRPLRAQADGLQGRVRGRPAAAGAGGPRRRTRRSAARAPRSRGGCTRRRCGPRA